jgi:hypothetical protein
MCLTISRKKLVVKPGMNLEMNIEFLMENKELN